jgi:hypothetical protein
MWHELAPTEIEFVERSPERLEFDMVVFAPRVRVLEVLVGEREMHEWLEPLVEVRWTTPSRGVGAKREIVLDLLKKGERNGLTTLGVKERFLAWERGKRLAFAVEGMTLPLARRMIEDMQLERLGQNKTRLLYTVHFEPSLMMRAVLPVARVFFEKMFRDAVRRIAMISARGEIELRASA